MEDTVKNIAFVAALVIVVIGAIGIVMPSGLVWVAQYSLTPTAFYLIGVLRVGLGLVLVSVASASRAPGTLRILGYIIVTAGIGTVVLGMVAIDRARAIVEWWLQQGSGLIRLAGVLIVALGSFLAYACAPARRAA